MLFLQTGQRNCFAIRCLSIHIRLGSCSRQRNGTIRFYFSYSSRISFYSYRLRSCSTLLQCHIANRSSSYHIFFHKRLCLKISRCPTNRLRQTVNRNGKVFVCRIILRSGRSRSSQSISPAYPCIEIIAGNSTCCLFFRTTNQRIGHTTIPCMTCNKS